MRVLVLGLGVHGGGLGVTRFMVGQGAQVRVTDMKGPDGAARAAWPQLDGLPVEYALGGHREEDLAWADLIVRNPGVPRESPWLALAAALGKPVRDGDQPVLPPVPRADHRRDRHEGQDDHRHLDLGDGAPPLARRACWRATCASRRWNCCRRSRPTRGWCWNCQAGNWKGWTPLALESAPGGGDQPLARPPEPLPRYGRLCRGQAHHRANTSSPERRGRAERRRPASSPPSPRDAPGAGRLVRPGRPDAIAPPAAYLDGEMLTWRTADGDAVPLVQVGDLQVPGRHNQANALCAAALALSAGVAVDDVRRGAGGLLGRARPPGAGGGD